MIHTNRSHNVLLRPVSNTSLTVSNKWAGEHFGVSIYYYMHYALDTAVQ